MNNGPKPIIPPMPGEKKFIAPVNPETKYSEELKPYDDEMLAFCLEQDAGYTEETREFFGQMAKVADMPYMDFLCMMHSRPVPFEQKIFVFASPDFKIKVAAIKNGEGKVPEAIYHHKTLLFTCFEFCRQDMMPIYEFFKPDFSQLPFLPKEARVQHQEGFLLIKPFGVELKKKHSMIIKPGL